MKNYPKRTCVLCGYLFTPKTYKSRFCSGLCKQRFYRREIGGQYAPAIGDSTKDQTDRETDLAALRDFEAALEAAKFGVVSGREW